MARHPALPSVTSFGELLHYLRRQARLTQRELAIATGYSESMISRLEHDDRPPDVATIQALFAPALHLEEQPEAVAKLITLARQARGEPNDRSRPEPTAGRSHALLLRRRLPARLTSFVGREAEVRSVAQLLGRTRLVTVTGPGGCGKTSLAVETCRRLADLAAQPEGGDSSAATGPETGAGLALDEVCFVELLPLHDPNLLVQTILAALLLEGNPQQTAQRTLLDTIGDRRVLLVLDNCEHLIDAVAALALALLQECPNLRLLITSRERLTIAGETVFVVTPLAFPDLQRLPARVNLANFPAIQLFVERCQAVVPAFQLTDHNATAVAQICNLLDGVPLALELAAAATATFSVQEIAERLDAHLLRASPTERATDPRHASIADAVAWSYQLLLPAEQRLLAQLAVFAGGWTAEAMQQVCIGAIDCTAVLHQLVQKSLVQVDPGQPSFGRMRYHLLRAVREYAAEQFAANGEKEGVRRRHFDYYARLGAALGDEVLGADHNPVMAGLDVDHANIQTALMYGRGQAHLAERYMRLAAALVYYWRLRGYIGESTAWLRADPACAGRLSLAAQALAHAALLAEMSGAHYWFNQHLEDGSDLSHALAAASALIKACLEQGENAPAARLLLMLAGVHEYKGDNASAEAEASEAWRILTGCGEVRDASLACIRWMRALLAQGKLEAAARLQEETAGFLERHRLRFQLCESYSVHCDIAQAKEDRAGLIRALMRIAEIAEEAKFPQVLHDAYCALEAIDREMACRMAEAYLARQRQQSPSVMLGLAFHQLGRIHLNAGRYAQASCYLDEALQHWQTMPLPAREMLGAQWSLIDRGETAWFQGDCALAVACFDESIRLFNASPYRVFSMYPLLFRGYARCAAGELDRALDDLRAGLHMLKQAPEGWGHCYIYFLAALGDVALRRGMLATAAKLLAASAVLEEGWPQVASSCQPHEIAHYASIMANVPQYRQEPVFAAGWHAGKALTPEEAVELALAQ